MRTLYENHGYTGFMFYDDELNVSKTMIELMNAVSDLQEDLGVDFRLRGFIKAELFTPAQAKAMYRAGFRWILTGFEGAHPRILDNIQKRATVEDNTRCVEIAKSVDLKVKALMSIGHPGEDLETVEAVKEWLIKVQPDDFDCTIITVYPGTPYYDFAVANGDHWTYTAKSGDRLHSYDLDYTMTADYYKGAPDGGYKAYVFTDRISSEALVQLRDDVEKTVRRALGIPFNQSAASLQFEHSMGQGLPGFIFKSSEPRDGK
jgi:anaerobic magnesium-protoporphyrin IX monomethyl ester cyclase